ncbi:MAG: PIN domain-containing protein [Euryarchaeota archaeon]|nr:PIN domain-containing protein [Euryarchaeota archaeon]
MRLVVDSNVVFAALLRDGATRAILVDPPLGLVAPEWMLAEMRRHRRAIIERANLSGPEFNLLFLLVTDGIEIVARVDYDAFIGEATNRMRGRDPGDAPFLALALALDCDGIWTQNVRHFENTGARIWTTKDLLSWTSDHERV